MTQMTVSVDDDHIETIRDVASALVGRGMIVDQVLQSVGVIIGSAPDVLRNELGSVEGVASIEDANTFTVPPPDSLVQ
jgi:hypothetical protein